MSNQRVTSREVIHEAAKDTAVKIRKSLKAEFPGCKFSVRSSVFSGGNSVDVSWTDGPTQKAVDEVLNRFQSGSFDGMQDLYTYGSYEYEGKLYCGAKYVDGQRDITPEYRVKVESFFLVPADRNAYEYHRYFLEAEQRMIEAEQAPKEEAHIHTDWKCSVCGTPDIEESGNDGGMGYCPTCGYKTELVKKGTDEQIEQVEGVTVTLNEEKHGVEIRFAKKPAAGIIETLKENGFHWSGRGFWYAKQTAERIKLAYMIAGTPDVMEEQPEEVETVETLPEVETVAPAPEPVQEAKPEQAGKVISFVQAKAKKLTTWTPVQTLMLHTVREIAGKEEIALALAHGITPEKLFEMAAQVVFEKFAEEQQK